jgi:sigma-E factor negative regulatory protein RseA
MNEKLSTLMDGELERSEARTVIKSLSQDPQHRQQWDCYHLIGDVLRGETGGESVRHRACAASIFERLAKEPTILSPAAAGGLLRSERNTRIALAMAASVVTISAIGVVAFKQQGATVAPVQLVQQVAPRAIADPAAGPNPAQVRVNDYLAIHRQFANPSALQEAAIRRSAPQAQTGGR